MIFARKMPEFYIIIARKIFFSGILVGHVPPVPVSYAYAYSAVCTSCDTMFTSAQIEKYA